MIEPPTFCDIRADALAPISSNPGIPPLFQRKHRAELDEISLKVWADRASNLRSSAIQANTLATTPPDTTLTFRQ